MNYTIKVRSHLLGFKLQEERAYLAPNLVHQTLHLKEESETLNSYPIFKGEIHVLYSILKQISFQYT